jgi:hypothetical protein
VRQTLGNKQRKFTRMLAELVIWAYDHGYELTYGEAWRTPQQAEWNAANGKGISPSLHTSRLAVDFNLFINGKYQTSTEAHRPLGEKWESMGGTWGGRFGDGNHYSLEHGGVK